MQGGYPVDLRTELLVIERALYKPDDPQLSASLTQLGQAWIKAEQPATAEPLLREALAAYSE